MKQNKKIWLVTLAIAFALALCAGCTRKSNNYYPNFNPGTFVSVNNNYSAVPLTAQANNYNPGPSVVQTNNYCLGPSVSVITGTLVTQTIGLTNVYALKTACPIKVSNNNIIVNNISMFQLTGCGPNMAPYIGSQVWLTGKFFLGCTANNETQLMMEVSKFEAFTTVPVSECPPISRCPPAVTQQCNPQGYAQCNTQSYAQCDVQSYTQCNVENPAQCSVQSSVQGNVQSSTQGNTQSSAQGNTQGGTQINTQINAQGNAQVNAQINIQSNTKNSTQSSTQSARKPAAAAKKPPIKKPAPVNPSPPPKVKTYRIQVGAFCDPANAQKAVTRLQRQNLCPVKENYRQYTRVVLRGISANRVDNTVAAVKRAGFDDSLIQRE